MEAVDAQPGRLLLTSASDYASPGKPATTLSAQTTTVDNHIMPPKTSTFLALPLELIQQIFSHFEVSDPSVLILRRTHPSFRQIITRNEIHKWMCTKILWTQRKEILLAADRLAADLKQPLLFLPELYACFCCLKVLSSDKFSDRNTYGSKRKGGKAADYRFCLGCGILRSIYQYKDRVKVNRSQQILALCGPVTVGSRGSPRPCSGCLEDDVKGPIRSATPFVNSQGGPRVDYHLRFCDTGDGFECRILTAFGPQLFQKNPNVENRPTKEAILKAFRVRTDTEGNRSALCIFKQYN